MYYKFEVSGDEIKTFTYLTEANNLAEAESNATSDLIGDNYDSIRVMAVSKTPLLRAPYMNFNVHVVAAMARLNILKHTLW